MGKRILRFLWHYGIIAFIVLGALLSVIVLLYFKWNPDTVSMLRMIYEFGKVFIICAFSFLWLLGLVYYQLCVKYKDLTSRSLLYDTREYELSPLKMIHYAIQSDEYLLDLKQFNRQDWKHSDGILFGYSYDGRLIKLSSSTEANIFIAGAPGSRKTTGIVLPTCSSYKGSILAVDIKGDIYNFSKSNRKIKRFCPDLTDKRGKNIALEKSCCFDPFFGIEELSPTDRKLFVENMSMVLIPDDNEKDNYFSTNARKLFRGILLFLLAICPTLSFPEYIAAVLHHKQPIEYNSERFPVNVFQWIKLISESSNMDAVECVAGMLGNNEKNIAGVFDRLCTGLTPYSNDILSVLLGKSDNSITPKVLEQGYDVYLQISQSNLDVYAPLFTLIIQQFMTAFSRRPDTSSGCKNRPILMILDEFPQLTFPYKYINSALSTLRSKSVQCMLVAQSVAQLNKKYGNDGCQSLLANCSYQLCLKANDIVTQEHFSKLIGTKKTLKINYSTDNNAAESREPVYYPESFGALDDKLVIYYNGRHEMINKIKPFK